jgi:hypothetical protein
MTTLTINTNTIDLCSKGHTPNKAAISVVAHNADDADYYTFCEVCEQNIDRFSYYDDDCGVRYSKWSVTK